MMKVFNQSLLLAVVLHQADAATVGAHDDPLRVSKEPLIQDGSALPGVTKSTQNMFGIWSNWGRDLIDYDLMRFPDYANTVRSFKIWLIRHGRSQNNARIGPFHIHEPSLSQEAGAKNGKKGVMDRVPVLEGQIELAAEADGKYIPGTDRFQNTFNHMVCSPQLRTVDTALSLQELFMFGDDQQINIVPRLKEESKWYDRGNTAAKDRWFGNIFHGAQGMVRNGFERLKNYVNHLTYEGKWGKNLKLQGNWEDGHKLGHWNFDEGKEALAYAFANMNVQDGDYVGVVGHSRVIKKWMDEQLKKHEEKLENSATIVANVQLVFDGEGKPTLVMESANAAGPDVYQLGYGQDKDANGYGFGADRTNPFQKETLIKMHKVLTNQETADDDASMETYRLSVMIDILRRKDNTDAPTSCCTSKASADAKSEELHQKYMDQLDEIAPERVDLAIDDGEAAGDDVLVAIDDGEGSVDGEADVVDVQNTKKRLSAPASHRFGRCLTRHPLGPVNDRRLTV